MKVSIKDNLSKKILIWYDKNKRDLPWRKPKNDLSPYQTWISEIMLQQTTVKAVIPYFHKFTSKWPTIKKLSESNIEDIMDPRDTRPMLCEFIEMAQPIIKTQLGPTSTPYMP